MKFICTNERKAPDTYKLCRSRRLQNNNLMISVVASDKATKIAIEEEILRMADRIKKRGFDISFVYQSCVAQDIKPDELSSNKDYITG